MFAAGALAHIRPANETPRNFRVDDEADRSKQPTFDS
jgi:hypothetical protein